ncbi:hypothetical protein UA08_09036 [Talaromyces atroroseus]|uniref:Karyogamy protein n=1 Tax=Talaromyces atroroseus TaxID=1441469 RepID=A0A1Q5Q6Y7_TALAT|nr:hypothetical protein UA08_09036 [Talaromyces atroroseus]OKL55607.1 hypothetical protein UA08_09036 [Talaromyces atroroseus]
MAHHDRRPARPLPSPVARLLKHAFTAASPRHVEPSQSLIIHRRVYESVIDRVASGPLLFQRRLAPAAPPRVAAKCTSPPNPTPTPTSTSPSPSPAPFASIASKPTLPHLRVFSAATTATATTACTDSAVIVVKRSKTANAPVSMPVISFVPGSPTTPKPPSSTDTAIHSLKSLTKKFSAPQLSQSSSSAALSPPSTARKLRPEEDTANDTNANTNTNTEDSRASIFRRLSPGLAARVKLLSGSVEPTRGKTAVGVGKIPQDHLRELDSLHQDLSIKVEKRGRAWPGLQIKRERSAPDLLQSPSPTKTQSSPQPQTQLHDFASEIPLPSTPTSTIEYPSDDDARERAAASTMTTVEPAMTEERSTSQDVEAIQESGSSDLEEYLKRSTLEDQAAPSLPPKDTPPAPSTPSSTNLPSYFSPRKMNRAESIYSFSRASFSNQLSQLTSINLPQPAALEASISSIVNAPTAVRALMGAAEQIETWMNKASDVLNGLDAEDDVEWAAAGGREGLEEVDKAVVKFESLVDVYVKAIENVQLRDDIDDVRASDLTLIVSQMDATLKNWASIRTFLKGVKAQVELAMEWEELWNNVLGDVGLEIDNLSRLIFEMEEKRHKSLAPESEAEPGNGLDINELETIVEETPFHGTPSSATNKRLSLALFPAADNTSNATAGNNSNPQDDANLMQLFARMQPLRASLDFLPMRLSMFHARAEALFPTACEELEDRKRRLETSYKKLESDAEALRRELGEDRWILVFRNAGKQAQKMCESVERSIGKLQESLEAGDPANNPIAITKKIESYEAKKIHYVPAISRVMTIIQKGVHDRLTVNGEVLTLLSDMNQRVDALKASMKVMDSLLEETTISKSQHLRDSISSIITADSPANTSLLGTPGSSPASSVIVTGYTSGVRTPNAAAAAAAGGSSRRGSSVGSTSRTATTASRRLSGIPTAVSSRKPSTTLSVHSSTTPTPAPRSNRLSSAPTLNRPRWNASTNTSDLDVGHSFKSLSPSPYRNNLSVPSGRTSRSTSSSLPVPSPLSRATSSSPAPTGRTGSRMSYRSGSRLGTASPTSPSMTAKSRGPSSLLDPPAYNKLRKSAGNLPTGLRNRQSYGGPMTVKGQEEEAEQTTARPGTSLGHGHSSRRTSLLPQPKGKTDERPRWR